MCRAYMGIALKKNDEAVKSMMRGVMLNYTVNSRGKGNDDGFFMHTYKPDGKADVYRSLNYISAMDKIKETEFNHVFHGHARMGNRGGVCDKYVHGWTLKGFTCTHNGTIDLDKAKYPIQDENDSVTFFKNLFDKCWDVSLEKFVANIKRFCEEDISGGNGVFFMVSKKISIAISYRKDIHINKINDDLLVLNSQNDIHEFKDEISIDVSWPMEEQEISVGPIKLKRNYKRTETCLYPAEVVMTDNHYGNVENCVLAFNNDTGELIRKVDLDVKGFRHTTQQTQMGGTHNSAKTSNSCGMKREMEKVVIVDNDIMDLDDVTAKYFDLAKEVSDKFEEVPEDEVEAALRNEIATGYM